jgi:hypothetical protein
MFGEKNNNNISSLVRTHKTKDRVTRTQLKTGGERMPKNSFLFLAKYWNLASTSSKENLSR